MKELYRKYIDNKLTREGLNDLKNKSDNLGSDRDLLDAMQEEWLKDNDDYQNVSDIEMCKVKSKLDDKIHHENRSIPLYYKIIGWVAVMLLPLFILSTFYLYNEKSQRQSDEITVSTAQGEKANVTLPDGTVVSLNSESKLTYAAKMYNKESRQLHFSGEGYFVVAKDENRPFLIDAKGLRVKVLGTKFNLSVRDSKPNAELFLESGSVQFTSLLKKEAVIIKPNQKVIMNQLTGKMTVKDETLNDAPTWRKNEIIFRNVPLNEVIKGIENIYNVRIKINKTGDALDVFTGTLVTDDLNGVLEVLERTYNLKAIMINGEISMVRLK